MPEEERSLPDTHGLRLSIFGDRILVAVREELRPHLLYARIGIVAIAIRCNVSDGDGCAWREEDRPSGASAVSVAIQVAANGARFAFSPWCYLRRKR